MRVQISNTSPLAFGALPQSNEVVPVGLAALVRERDPNDPIAEPDFTVEVVDRVTGAGVAGAEIRFYRSTNGAAAGGVESAPASSYTQALGYFGEGRSAYEVFVHAEGYEAARTTAAQTLTGAGVQFQLQRHALIYEAGAAGAGVAIDAEAATLTLTEAITLQALYSYVWDQWGDDDDLPAAAFPFLPQGGARLGLINGWTLAGGSLAYLSGAGLEALDESLEQTARWANLATVGSPGTGVQLYYSQNGGAATEFSTAEGIDELVDVTVATTSLVIYARAQGRTYAQVDVNEASGDAVLDATRYPVALITVVDDAVQDSDATVATEAPYTGMTVSYEDPAVERTLNGVTETFNVVVDANGGSHLEAHTFLQWYLRQPANLLRAPMTTVSGGVVTTAQGVFIDGLGSGADSVVFTGLGGEQLAQPALATVTIRFASELIGGAFRVWTAASFAAGSPVAVVDAGGNVVHDDLEVPGGGVVTFSYDHAEEGDLEIIVQAINPGSGRFSAATGTITSGGLGLQLATQAETAATYDEDDTVAATLDGATRRINITDPGGGSTSATARAHYDTWVQWCGVAPYTGLSYPPAFQVSGGETAGGTTTSPRFILFNGWVVAAGHSHTVAGGGSLVAASGEALLNTSGGPVLTNTVAVDAQVVEVEGLSAQTAGRVSDLWTAEGLNPSSPRQITDTSDRAGTVQRTINDDGTTTTVQRQ